MSLVSVQEAQLQRLGAHLLTENILRNYEMAPEEAAKIRQAEDWLDAVNEFFILGEQQKGAILPWQKTKDLIRIRPAELSIWAGPNGSGKSLLTSQAILGLIRQGQKACIASLEMRPLQTMVRMVRQGVGGESPNEEWVDKFARAIGDRLWIYDQIGTVDARKMLAVMRYAREKLECDHFVIDSLMKCGLGVDDYNGQKKFIDQLSTYAKDSGLHIHLVCHSRKRQSEKEMMDKNDVKGAGEITDMADNVFTLWRNKPKEKNERAGKEKDATAPDAVMVCDKQRNGDWEGDIAFWFLPGCQQFVGKQTTQPMDMLEFPYGGR